MSTSPKIFAACHRGMVGSAIVGQLQAMDCHIVDAHNDGEMYAEMVTRDLQQAKQYALLKQHGYNVNLSVE